MKYNDLLQFKSFASFENLSFHCSINSYFKRNFEMQSLHFFHSWNALWNSETVQLYPVQKTRLNRKNIDVILRMLEARGLLVFWKNWLNFLYLHALLHASQSQKVILLYLNDVNWNYGRAKYQTVSSFVSRESRNQTFYTNRVHMNFPKLRLVRFQWIFSIFTISFG